MGAAGSGLFKIAVAREDHDKAKEIPVIRSSDNKSSQFHQNQNYSYVSLPEI